MIYLGHTFWGNYDHGTNLLKVNAINILNIQKLSKPFLEQFIWWLLLQIDILLLKSGTKKHIALSLSHIALSVNKEAVNQNTFKKVFVKFTKILERSFLRKTARLVPIHLHFTLIKILGEVFEWKRSTFGVRPIKKI